MFKKSILILLIALLLLTSLVGQTTQTTQLPQKQTEEQKPDDDDVVRISTNLIQIDATVTDKNGKQVTNLTPDDFEILENGKKQKITNFSYITVESDVSAEPTANAAKKNNVPSFTRTLKPEQVRRTLVLFVDDFCLSLSSIYYVKKSLKNYVDKQVQEGDLVALFRATGGEGVLQQFTSNKQQLYAAIDKVRFNPIAYRQCGNNRVGAFDDYDGLIENIKEQQAKFTGKKDDPTLKDTLAQSISERQSDRAASTLTALDFVVRGMSELPGRKAVIMFSEGFNLVDRKNQEIRTLVSDYLRVLTDRANRASVVIYTIDPTGVLPAGITAGDNIPASNVKLVQSVLSARRQSILDAQDGLKTLSELTGGYLIKNTNDIEGGVKKIIDDQKGYYLIGYQPDDSTFDPNKSRYNKLTLKVKGKGLNVRYRSGFFGIKDEERKKTLVAETPKDKVLKALYSPFASGDINLQLTSMFTNEDAVGSHIRTLIHISAKDLSFVKEDGRYKTVIDVIALTHGNDGNVIDQVSKVYTLSISEADYDNLLKQGFIYSLNVPIKKAGGYHLRVVVRDEKSEKIGSANQYMEIPDLNNERLALSGLIIGGGEETQHASADGFDSLTQTVLKRFSKGSVLQYGFFIYNAVIDKNTNRPNLKTQIRLYRDGKEVFVGKENQYDANGQADLKRLTVGGAVELAGLQPGEYILHVVVTDTLAKEKYRTTSRWIDFEIVQ